MTLDTGTPVKVYIESGVEAAHRVDGKLIEPYNADGENPVAVERAGRTKLIPASRVLYVEADLRPNTYEF